ncbi:hypothetical protein ACIBW9_01900 [Streptomyces sp. NPDC049541]|uniref:hypothetical protein n=1 Tax=Streptomyces sp. NPDC049541 TaxID=3365594 RepID=UPI0037B2E6E7
MTVPQCVHAPGEGPAHGAKGWHVVVTVTITVVVLASIGGVTPEWLSAAAALIGVLVGSAKRS